MADILRNITLNEERFLDLLEKLIGSSEKVQNGPNNLPQESVIVDYVLDVLKPYMVRCVIYSQPPSTFAKIDNTICGGFLCTARDT